MLRQLLSSYFESDGSPKLGCEVITGTHGGKCSLDSTYFLDKGASLKSKKTGIFLNPGPGRSVSSFLSSETGAAKARRTGTLSPGFAEDSWRYKLRKPRGLSRSRPSATAFLFGDGNRSTGAVGIADTEDAAGTVVRCRCRRCRLGGDFESL